jgi:membrane associated rhomboid family serine protease
MTPTPVGMRCPECSRQTTNVRRMPSGAASSLARRAPATVALIAVNVAVFVVELATGGPGASLFDVGGRFTANGLLYGPAVANGDWWRLVTSGFLHAGLLHIAFNMYALYFLGLLVEPAIGTVRFLAVYAVSLLAGSAGVLLLTPNSPSLGASGAIFGLMSAAYLIARHRGIHHLAQQILGLGVINLLLTFGIPRISIGAHLGGLVGGAVAALVITYGQRHFRSLAPQLAAMAALAALCVAIALAVA